MRSIVFALIVLSTVTCSAGQKYAFLVAVSDYDRKELEPLQFTRNDILELHKALLDAGYVKSNIVLMHDDAKSPVERRFIPESSRIRNELKLLTADLEPDDTLILAFSGHGIQFKGEKQNYFCPVDASLEDRSTLISVSEIYLALEKCPARQKLMLVDACRDNPQSKLGRAGSSVELESVSRPQTVALPEGFVALFSCAIGERSFEDPDLKHGIFFYHVLQALSGTAKNAKSEVTLDELVAFTKKKTHAYARTSFSANQRPQQVGEYTGTWILRSFQKPKELPIEANKPIVMKPSAPFDHTKAIRTTPNQTVDSTVPSGKCYAFLVAVGDYDRTELKPLKYTRADILDFRQALVESGVSPGNIVHLHDDTKLLDGARLLSAADNIREEFEILLGGLDKDDTLIVAFAGHGIQFKGEKESYFCPRNARLSKRSSLVSFADILKQMDACPASRKLLLVDACRNEPQTDNARSRAEVSLESVTRPQVADIPKSLLAFFSCGPGQQSYEDSELGHGIFFHHVLKGWKGDADGNSDGSIDFEELHTYVRRETKEYARLTLKALQTPQLKGELSDEWILRSSKTTSAPPTAPVNVKTITSVTTGMKLVLIRAGEYLRGSPATDKDASNDEKTQHRVRITKDFYIGMCEVTQGEWKTVMETAPWKSNGQMIVEEGKDIPVTHVTWKNAQEFCEKLSQKDRRTYRLPTEAEWEYACRGGTTTRYSFGDDETELGEFAWYDKNASTAGERYVHRVGKKKANPFGLHDMHGNVAEWCSDWFDVYSTHGGRTVDDPAGAESGSARMTRGGSWISGPAVARSASRSMYFPTDGNVNIGFRVLAVSPPK